MPVQLSWFASVFLFRIVLPIIALGATIVRFNCFSLLYGCLLLVSSLLPKPSPITLKGATGRFLIVSAVLCTLTLVAQVTFQVVLLAIRTDEKPYGTVLTNCSMLESTLRQIGLQRLEPNDFLNITRVILPDIVMFITAVIVCMACFRLCRDEQSADDSGYEGEGVAHGGGVKKRVIDKTLAIALYAYGILTMILLWFSGIAYPSLLSMVYFVTFISVATYWSCYGHFGSKLAVMRLLMLTYCAAHLVVLYLYQFQFFQEALNHETFVARLVGLTGIIRTDCNKPWVLKFHDNDDIKWSMYVSAAMILLLYLRLAHEIRCWKKLPKEIDLSQLLRTRRMSPARSRHELDPEQESLVARGTPGPPDASTVPVEVGDDPQVAGRGEGRRSRDMTLPLETGEDGVNDAGITALPHVDTPASNAPMKRTVLMSVCVFIMKQSYVFALIIMMTWSITFHSWLTFIYLMAACLIWIMPKKRQVCLKCSPLILMYAELLLFIQYIYGFNLKELPSTIYEGWALKEIGLVKYKNPAVALLVQVAYTVVFWLLMRQRKRERLMARRQMQPPDMQLETTTHSKSRILPSITDMVDGVDGQTIQAFGKFLHHILSKYWILVCAALFLVMAILEAVIFRIIYMFLFLYFILTFQVTYRWWRFSIKAFWWFVIIYSMVVLCLIYTYQFEHVPAFWMNVTGLQNTTLSDIGLETFDTATLFAKLLTPTSFLIVIIIQLHYFQKGFLIISAENRFRSPIDPTHPNNAEANTHHNGEPIAPTTTEVPMDRSGLADQSHVTTDTTDGKQSRWLKRRFARYWLLCYDLINKLSVLLWQFLEVHIFKAVVLTIFSCCIAEVTALNLIYVLIVVCLVPAKPLHGALSNLCQCWTAVVILAKMMFQLNLVSPKVFQNCTELNITDTSARNSEYLGLVKTGNLAEYLRFYIAILLILALEKIVKLHQKQYYGHPDHERPLPGIIFPGITREKADDNIRHCIKFFVNYGFYKFGLELCFIMTMITMVVRLDIYSVLYGLLLCIILPMNRRVTYVLWQPYLAFLVLVLLFEYLLCLGLPPAFCLAYPWDEIGLDNKLQIYLYLPSYDSKPNQMKLLLDFLQLLFASLQLFVFKIEKDSDYRNEYGGGDNDCDIEKMDRMIPGQPNDFIAKKTSYLDYLKAGLFQYMFWLTLMIVFIAGVARISFLCLGYLLACFIFLWWGNDLLIKPLRSVLRLWGILLGYNFAVILCKSCLQLAGCVYINKLTCDICWLVQLFGIVCLQPHVYKLAPDDGCNDKCKAGEDDSGLVYDSIAFALLLLQMRVFKSSYFQYVVFDLRVQNRLASMGAEVINKMLIQRVEKRKQDEQETLNKIRRKVDRIRRRQKNHDTSDHYLVVRSGGEFMFDAEDEAEDIESTDHFGEDKEVTSEEDTVGPLDILSTAIYRGTRRALAAASRRSSRTESDPPDVDKRFSNESKTESIAEESAFEEQEDEHPPPPSASSRYRAVGASGDGPNRSTLSRTRTVSNNEDAALSKRDRSFSDATVVSVQDAAGAGHGDPTREQEDQSDDEDDKDGGESCWTRFKMTMLLAWKFIAAFLDYVIKTLDAISDAYRKVLTILKKEQEEQKKILRQKQAKENVENLSADRYVDITAGRRSRTVNDEHDRLEASSSTERRTQSCPAFDHNGADAKKDSVSAHSNADEELLFRREMPRLFLLVIAFWEASVSQSEVVCFFAMILNHMVSASLLSLPYPLAVFLWAMLAVPRPAKTYWVTVITYAEAVVVVKYLFQFAFFPWNANADPLSSANEGPFWPPRIIGIEKMDHFAAYDLFLLLCLFYHRSVLKSHGLWRDSKATHDALERAVDTVTSTPPSPMVVRAPQGSQLQVTASCPASPIQVTLDQKIPAPPLSPEVGAAGDASQQQGTDVVGNEIVPVTDYGDADSSHIEGKECCSCIRRPLSEFYNEVVNPRYNAPTDVYAPMFFCDLIAFVITVFGYSYFRPVVSTGSESESETVSHQDTTGETVKSVIEDNKVPIPFLVMLLAQFILMLIDRAIFLRKQVFGKFIFQILLVLVVHSWLFFILPAVTNRPFSQNLPAQLWYLVKCVYFGLSAYQIHCGYPTRILGNFLTKKYNYFNLVLFKGFLVVPFLLEMRVLMDWIWTDTTLALTHWLQMEDIYANIFVIKCFRDFEKNWPTPRGTQVSALVKYGVGGLVLFLLIFVIWFPLLVFSLLTTVYVPYPPTDCTVTVRLGGYQPLFRMSAQQQTLQKISATEHAILREEFKLDPAASAFMNQYQQDDIYIATITSQSTAVWGISPPSRGQLHKELENRTDLFLYFDIAITRDPPRNPNVAVETVANSFSLLLDASDPLIYQARRNLSCMIRGETNSTVPECINNTLQVLLNKSYPVYVHVPPSGKPLSPQEKWSMENAKLGNMSLKLKTEGYDSWWELYNHPFVDGSSPTHSSSVVKIYTFNDRVAPGTISVITSYGIIGLYISLVFVIGRFVRMFVSGISYRMMFEELPDVDHILNLCLDIYLVRERRELELEEQLFAKLHFLFRSPSMLLQWTKYKQE